jgi:hypothetical protein
MQLNPSLRQTANLLQAFSSRCCNSLWSFGHLHCNLFRYHVLYRTRHYLVISLLSPNDHSTQQSQVQPLYKQSRDAWATPLVPTSSHQPTTIDWTRDSSPNPRTPPIPTSVLGNIGNFCSFYLSAPGSSLSSTHNTFNTVFCAAAEEHYPHSSMDWFLDYI